MDKQQLIWIIPLSVVIRFLLGYIYNLINNPTLTQLHHICYDNPNYLNIVKNFVKYTLEDDRVVVK